VFVTAQGSRRTRFRRAIERRSLSNAELAARELVEQALQLAVLYTEQEDDPRAERAMVKWLGRGSSKEVDGVGAGVTPLHRSRRASGETSDRSGGNR
jgi:hypothetical protein